MGKVHSIFWDGGGTFIRVVEWTHTQEIYLCTYFPLYWKIHLDSQKNIPAIYTEFIGEALSYYQSAAIMLKTHT